LTEKLTEMAALVFNGKFHIKNVPKPLRNANEVLIRVTMAGICNTDLEITRGYIPGFNGIPGHEFIGIIEEADDTTLSGKKCTAEINCACGTCEYCKNDLGRHCPNRTVLGIINRNGAFAEYICVPEKNIVLIPDSIPDNHAIFIEPLAAALEILDQVTINRETDVLLLGDGKLGLLAGYVLASTGCNLMIVGKHPEKLAHITNKNTKTVLLSEFTDSKFDIVVEATGNASAFEKALQNVKPRGTLVLKSTYAGAFQFNPSRVVVDEISIIGSRCGEFPKAIEFLLHNNTLPVEKLISAEMKLEDGIKAFEYSALPDVLKVILNI
jgi:2-desacetyl-2-hydroxyethyl bacteriochlorophyllide A dehydrogenase